MIRIKILLAFLATALTLSSCYKDELGRIEEKVDRNHEAILDLKDDILNSMLTLESSISLMKDEIKDHTSDLSATQVELAETLHNEVRSDFTQVSTQLDSITAAIDAGNQSLELELLRAEMTTKLLEIQNQYITIEKIVADNLMNEEKLDLIIAKLNELLEKQGQMPEVIIVRDTILVEGETVIKTDTIYQTIEVPISYEICETATEKISPVFEGYDADTNEYIWGYSNRNTCIVLIVHGNENKLNNGHGGATVQIFLPGRHTDAFRTPAGDGNTVWTLRSPNGRSSTSTANKG